MTADSITIGAIAAMSKTLAESSASLDHIRNISEMGELDPQSAAQRVNRVLEFLKLEMTDIREPQSAGNGEKTGPR